jgi:hypothetical protein
VADLNGALLAVPLYLYMPSGRALRRPGFNRAVWKPAIRAAGIIDARENGMHVLRHMYASVLLDAGESINRTSPQVRAGVPSLGVGLISGGRRTWYRRRRTVLGWTKLVYIGRHWLAFVDLRRPTGGPDCFRVKERSWAVDLSWHVRRAGNIGCDRSLMFADVRSK